MLTKREDVFPGKTVKTMKKSIVIFIIALFLGILSIPSLAVAKTPDLTYWSELDLPFLEVNKKLPAEYDLRDKNLVTSCKDQGWHGTCWSFAAISSAETNLLMKGLAGGEKKDPGKADLSELQLARFMYDRSPDPSGGTKGDKIINSTDADYLDVGGEAYLTTFALASWMGPVKEKKVETSYEDADKSTKLDKNLEYDLDLAHLRNAWWVNARDRDSVKSMLMKHGSPIICYYSGYWDYSYHEVPGASSTNMTYYNPYSGEMPDHEVAVIGWDDDYPAENFYPSPGKDGAWLVKNSWGSKWGNDGCFWLSYYDHGIDDYAVFLDFDKADNYQYIYQYDGGGSTAQDIAYKKKAFMSNVFKSKKDETLKAVSFFATQNSKIKYSIQIYTDITDPKDPQSGRPRLSEKQTGRTSYAGYYTVDLDYPVRLKEKLPFSVVIEFKTGRNENIFLPVDTDAQRYGWSEYDVTSAKGQSFVSKDGEEWEDLSADGDTNIRIKAFTDDSEPLWELWIAGAIGIIAFFSFLAALIFRASRKKREERAKI